MSSGELARRSYNVPTSRATQAAQLGMWNNTQVQLTAMRAIETVAESAMFEVVSVKRMQRELEQAVPEATEMLNLIAATACMAVAQSVHHFSARMSG